MSDRNQNDRNERTFDDSDAFAEGGLRAPPGLSTFGKIWWWFDFLVLVKLARLRFVGILVAIGLLIVYWDTLVAYYEKWTRPSAAAQAAESGVEYFCPMHPQVVTTDPKEKCPICAMNLSKRKKGEGSPQEALPAGVVNRLQLSPYRVVAAGVGTRDVGYEPLVKHITTVGSVEFDERRLRRISAKVSGKSRIDRLYVNVTGQFVKEGEPLADLYSPDLVATVQNLLDARRSNNPSLDRLARERLNLWGIDEAQIDEILRTGVPTTRVTIRSPISGYVTRKYQVEGEYVEEGARLYDVGDLSNVWVEGQVYEDDVAFLKEGLSVTAIAKSFPAHPFPGRLAFIDPHLDAATRTVRVRFDIANTDQRLRPGMYAEVDIEVPPALLGLDFRWRDGAILAVPEGSVIYTGEQKVVYRQEGPGSYDAVKVELGPALTGPREITFYPVLRGLEPGDKVVTSGSYLLDAETRVSAAAGSIYFGGGGAGKSGTSTVTSVRPTTPQDEDATAQAALSKLSTPDRALAERQRLCPVLANRLGSMGTPVKVVLQGQPVFLCCKGCEAEAREHADRTVQKTRALSSGSATTALGTATGADRTAAGASAKEERIKSSLAKLGPEDRALAEAQKYCPVLPANRLGSMGAPVKLVLNGRPVFLCCEGCEEEARASAERTLRAVEQLKAKAKGEVTAP